MNGSRSIETSSTTESTTINPNLAPPHPAVRFASVNQEIEPVHSLHNEASAQATGLRGNEKLSPETEEELRALAMSLPSSRLQESRMQNYGFEPVSLPPSMPVSRVR